jgi:GAF domain-containing protein
VGAGRRSFRRGARHRRIFEKAHTLCGAEHGSFVAYDGEQFRQIASHGMPEWFAARMREGYRPVPGSRQEQLLEGADFVHVSDIWLSPANPLNRLSIDAGTRTLLMVPLRKDDTLLGFFTGVRREVSPFSDKEISLLQNFAAQAVIAMENARLLSELRQRTDEIASWNRELEARVAEQVEELGRVGRLKRFLAPQLAELIVSKGDERFSKAIGARSLSCFATCAATPPSPKPLSPRKSSTSCANTTAPWGRSSASSRARLTSSRVMGREADTSSGHLVVRLTAAPATAACSRAGGGAALPARRRTRS